MFKRDSLYVVLKIVDIYKALTDSEIDSLVELVSKTTNYRKSVGKVPLQAVVVEHDWPEYELVWKMLEERVNAA